MNIVSNWFRRWTQNPQTVVLVMILLFSVGIVLFFGNMLTPVMAAMVIAYLLEGLIAKLTRLGAGRSFSVMVVYFSFLVLTIVMSIKIFPLLFTQLTSLAQEIPAAVNQGQTLLLMLPEKYPKLIDEEIIRDLITSIRQSLGSLSQYILSYAGQSVVSIINITIYAILVPLLIFFFLKDKQQIFEWISGLLPKDRALADTVGAEVNEQIGNYVRGKAWEIIIVWAATYITFSLLGLNYALLLSFLVGMSVIIPYIGATVVTIPVLVVAYLQWGFTSDFMWVFGAYVILQALDGNVLVPVLFSEVMNLHPIAIILALLMFGGIWGFWGIFFAIPLATVVHAVYRAWPRPDDPEHAANYSQDGILLSTNEDSRDSVILAPGNDDNT